VPTQDRSRQRVERILDAAASVFASAALPNMASHTARAAW
jgi:hypothetical protein